MSTYKELLKQREALEQQIKDARQREIAQAVTQVRSLVAEFGLTAQDVFSSGKARKSGTTHAKVAAKYRNPATGATWTGRGKPPKWIQGQDRAKFAIG
ncbi:MAG TPA: H-NS histone family protein [Rhodoferax sp.]|nr:H-NS histone family protein [Rhodoferax sp.]